MHYLLLILLFNSNVGQLIYEDETCGGILVFIDTCGLIVGATINADSLAGQDSSYYIINNLQWLTGDTVAVWQGGIRRGVVKILRVQYADSAGYSQMFIDSAGLFLRKDGSVALIANWNAGDFDITGLEKVEADSGLYSLVEITDTSTAVGYDIKVLRFIAGVDSDDWTRIMSRHISAQGQALDFETNFWNGVARELRQALTIHPSGRVGINKTLPTEKFEVDGNAKADTFIGYHRGKGDSTIHADTAGYALDYPLYEGWGINIDGSDTIEVDTTDLKDYFYTKVKTREVIHDTANVLRKERYGLPIATSAKFREYLR